MFDARRLSYPCILILLASACGDNGGASETSGSSSTGEAASSSGTGSSSTGGATESESTSDTGASEAGDTGAAEIDPRVAECLRINACEADGGSPIGLQVCLGHALDLPWLWASTGVQRASVQALACKLAAADCDGVRACTPALAEFADACAQEPGGSVCAGDSWVLCDPLGAPSFAFNCAAAGLQCGVDAWAGCGAEPCEFGVDEATCDGDVLVECNPAGFRERIDCPTAYSMVNVNGKDGEHVYSIAGETCGFDKMRNANGCIGTGEDCSFFSQACDGDVLETCAGGKLARRDCAALTPEGQGCGFIQSGPFGGAASCGLVAGACDLGADEACDAGVISFCDWDAPGTLDCVDAGYSGCATAMLGERRVAYCTP